LVKPEENDPSYLKEMFGPIVYKISKIIELEKKEFQRKTHGN
jgi:hypothetical protein